MTSEARRKTPFFGASVLPAVLFAPAFLSISVFVILPSILVFVYSFYTFVGAMRVDDTLTLQNWLAIIGDGYYISALLETIRIALVTTAICIVLGFPVAYYISSTKSKSKWLLLILLIVPFWISLIIRTFSWIYILGEKGIVSFALREMGLISGPVSFLYSEYAVVIGLTHFLLPYMIVNIYVSLENVDRNVIYAARSLGASEAGAFLKVTLPLARSGLAAGGLLTFVLAAGSYITPSVLGGPNDFLFANLISDAISSQLNWPMGSALAATLLLLLGGTTAIFIRFMGISQLYNLLSR
ncbi:MAG: ABC transporter permease [Mesorhizobium sp.]